MPFIPITQGVCWSSGEVSVGTVQGELGVACDHQRSWESYGESERQWLGRGIAPTVAPPQTVMMPQSRDELAEVMTIAHRRGLRVMPVGAGTKLSWGNLRSQIDVVIRCDRLNRVVERDPGDLTISVEAGMTLGALQRELASHNQFLPLDPSYPDTATLGGIVATADSGSLRQGYGGVRDMLLGIECVRHDGLRSQAGGKVVKNVAGYDLMKLFTGAYGTLGLISRLTWRVYPIPDCWQTIVVTGELDGLEALNRRVLMSPLTPVAWEWTLMPETAPASEALTPLGTGRPVLVGRFASVASSTDAQILAVEDQAKALGLTVQTIDDDRESPLWQQYCRAIAPSSSLTPQDAAPPAAFQIKLGVISTAVPSLLQALQRQLPGAIVQIRAGSGLGRIYLPQAMEGVERSILLKILHSLRDTCQTHQGFFSLLDAPHPLKSQFNPWGYQGQGKTMATALRQTFDPKHLLNPGCFVV